MDLSIFPKELLKQVRISAKDVLIAAVIVITCLFLLPCWIRDAFLYCTAFYLLTSLIFVIINEMKSSRRIQVKEMAVVISGCDTGFGHLLAQRLDDLGLQVFAGCLFPDGEGAQTLKKTASSRLHVIKMDVTKDEDIENAVTFVEKELGTNKLWAVVCNAGILKCSEISWTSVDVIEEILEVNTFGVVRLTKAFLPKICKTKGRIIAVSCVTGWFTTPTLVPYCMSKRAINSFCDGLRQEMYKWGVDVITVEPHVYKTAMTEKDKLFSYMNEAWESSPEEIKNLYPRDYVEKHVKLMVERFSLHLKDKVDDVIGCLEEAILAETPKHTYSPGLKLAPVCKWVLNSIPKPFSDLMLSIKTVAERWKLGFQIGS